MEITVWENSSKRAYWENGEWYMHFKHIDKRTSCHMDAIIGSINYEWLSTMYDYLIKECE